MPVHGHEHSRVRGDGPHGSTSAAARRRALTFALVANAGFLVVELVGGFLFGSLALLADAAHMTSDVLALAIALGALVLSQRPPTERHTYGFVRAEVLAAQANGVLLLAGAGAVLVEAGRRLADGGGHEFDAAGVIVVGGLGLVVNVVSALVLARAAGGDLNMRGALWHLTADALGSAAVVVAGIAGAVFDTTVVDTLASILISLLVIAAAWQLLRDATRVLLEAVPAGIDVARVRAVLESAAGVEAVHHVHVWSLASELPALSAHVVLEGPLSLHEAQDRSAELKQVLASEFGITHVTLEVECHTCLPEPGAPAHP
jgi:cobalt-zinc-cadmium efflux system protein